MAVIFWGCKNNSDPGTDLEQLQNEVRTKLKGSWLLVSATKDGADEMTLYDGFKITFTESTYSTINGITTWQAFGSWNFKDGTEKVIVRDDLIEVTLSFIGDSSLTLSFTLDENFGGRSLGLAGDYVFLMEKM